MFVANGASRDTVLLARESLWRRLQLAPAFLQCHRRREDLTGTKSGMI
jgi:hypothetical protein